MLYLGNGVTQIKVDENRALSVFPDFSDPTQFYYLPNFPHVAKMIDGTPAIRLLVYREDLDTVAENAEDAVAFLSLDVDLSWEPDVIDRAASRLRADNNLEQKPRLTPIFFRSGAVKLMLLDAATPEPTATGTPATPVATEFVAKIMGAGSPSLYGDNRAIFQAKLPKKGAAALQGALDGVTPIGVVYTLTFAGLQPAFNVKAHVDWQKVYDHWSEREGGSFLFVEVDIQKSIDKFVEDKIITIDVTVEGVGEEAMDAEREKAMTAIRQLIFEKFFEATLKREDSAGNSTVDNVVDGLASVAKNGLTLGMGYSYSRKEVNVEELRSLDLDWSARKATERTIYPQAHMHNLLTDGGITREQLVTIVDGADDLWKVLPFRVDAAAAWEQDGIVGIEVLIEYDDDDGNAHTWNPFLTKDAPSATKREWMDRRGGNGFRYRYKVSFQDDTVPGPRASVDTGADWIVHEGTVLVVHPRDLYDTHELEVATIPGFPYDRFPAVQAVLRYRTEDGSFEHYEDGVLSAAKASFSTRFRVDQGVPGQRELRLAYIGAEGRRVETPWMPMPQDQWVVEDPEGDTFTVRALVAGDRKNVANLIVDLEYQDAEHGIFESGTLQFDPQTIATPQTWSIHLADPTRRRYRYRMTMISTDGEFIQTGWIATDATTLPVGEVYVRRLTVQLATGVLAAHVEAVDVLLAYHDAAHDLHQEQSFRLGPNANAEWTVQLADAGRRDYQVTMTWIMDDGFNPKVGPTTRNDTFLAVPSKAPEQG